ncbi:MAG: DNA polymerase III subunit beta [Bacteroidia bacterium]|nr:DNA polymerase III subunit beta [Bacteroidia bacterium]MDW8334130.1 DNA polymerase III subunit beta [Bacteroidia bacterium]
MQFVVSSSELLRRLSAVSGVVPPKSVLAVLTGVHFKLEDGRLALTGSDLEVTIQTFLSVEAEAGAKFDAVVPSKILLDTIKALPEQPLRFHYDGEQTIKIVSDNGEYVISAYKGTDFPSMPPIENAEAIKIASSALVKAINKTIQFCSSDELKPAMTGVNFDFRREHATFAATDAHRLSRYRRFDVTVEKPVRFTLPQKALKQLVGPSLAEYLADEVVSLEYNRTSAHFRFGNIVVACRIIDANFPDFEPIIPQASPNRAIVGKKEFVSTLRRLAIYANKSTHMGRFKFEGNLLSLQAEDLDGVNRAYETLNCLYEGEDLEIGFNVLLMQEVVANADTEDVLIEMDTPGRTAVILPNVQETHEHLLMLLMPVMLSGY